MPSGMARFKRNIVLSEEIDKLVLTSQITLWYDPQPGAIAR